MRKMKRMRTRYFKYNINLKISIDNRQLAKLFLSVLRVLVLKKEEERRVQRTKPSPKLSSRKSWKNLHSRKGKMARRSSFAVFSTT